MAAFDYDSRIFSDEVSISADTQNLMGLKLKRFLAQIERLSPNAKLLEMGCGIGNISKIVSLHHPESELVGIDISRIALKIAKKSKMNMVCKGDVVKLPFKSNSFDVVFGFDIVEHVDKPEDLISESYRVLKPGGIAHFHIPCEGEPLTMWWLLWKLNFLGNLKQVHAGHLHRFTQQEIIARFVARSFRVINVNYSFHFIGQVLDFIQWFATSQRDRMENDNQTKGSCATDSHLNSDSSLINAIYALYKKVTGIMSRASYLESKILHKVNMAMALDITAIKNG